MINKQYDIQLGQASIVVFKELKRKYSYKRQIDRIYKFYSHNPPESAKERISSLKTMIQEVNNTVCGIECPKVVSF